MIFEWSWKYGELQVAWKLVNIFQFSRRVIKMTLETIGLSVTLLCLKIMEKIIFGVIEKHLKYNLVTDHSQNGFMRGKACLSNLISFYEKVTHLADQEKPVDVTFLDLCKDFDIISLRILVD